MSIYHQVEKEKSRELIWEHVISSLTYKRLQTTIVTPEILNEFTLKCANNIKDFYSSEDFIFNQLHFNQDWVEYHNSVYGSKKPSDLKIAFFCGPEPISDLKHILSRGVRTENIWAFEIDKENYEKAKDEIYEFGAFINIFEGNLTDFIKSNPQKFDIVYLDFTNSLLSKKGNPLLLLNLIFESSFISDFSNVILNTCYPDKNQENIEFLSRFFSSKKWMHRSILGSEEGSVFHESLDALGIYGKEQVDKLIDSKFEESYSDFSSAIPDLFTNVINPISNIIKLPTLNKKIFNLEKVKDAIERFSRVDWNNYDVNDSGGFDLNMSAENYAYWHFADNIISENKRPLSHYFSNSLKNENFTPFDTINFYSLMHSIEEGYFDAFSEEILNIVKQIEGNTIENQLHKLGLFCDVPMKHLWYSLLIGKYGYPFHINYNNHKRYDYTAKERKMCLDIFSFDRCRSLYDYIPSFEFISDFFNDTHRQLIIRCYMDKIYKTQFFYNDSFYSWGHLLFANETKHSFITEIDSRITIK